MLTFRGKSAFGGIAVGRICVYQKGQQQVKRLKAADTDAEVRRFHHARELAIRQLGELYETSLKKVSEAEAAIFEVHQMMLQDQDYLESVENIIRCQEVNAEYGVAVTADNFSRMFAVMEDPYMRERAADVKDVSERLLNVLTGASGAELTVAEPVIIVARDLAPSETVQLDKEKVLAFVTLQGSVNSHTAILAKTMGIPALVNTSLEGQGASGTAERDLLEQLDGKMGIVDGFQGLFYVEPEEGILQEMQARKAAEEKKKDLLQSLKGKPNVTPDGKEIQLYANVGNIRDLALVIQNDAGGIGLFRSEFLYLEKDDYPSEEEQFQIYKTVAETMAGKKVIIRTLDIGADKQAEYFGIPHEENPAMGYRAIRICLDRPEIFMTQLRAIFRASAYGNLAIMYPMIISLEEIRRIKELVARVKEQLDSQGLAYRDMEQGIMIETPAAVMISDRLAEEVDFFSIGTNDLTQYTLAIDRQNPKLDEFYDAHHPAVLKMIQMVVENAHKAGIWAGICGELGADTSLTETFLKMDVDELSVSPSAVLPVRKAIRETHTGNKQQNH